MREGRRGKSGRAALLPPRVGVWKRGPGALLAEQLGHVIHVLIAAAREVHDHDVIAAQGGRELHGVSERVRTLEGGDDAF